MQSLFAEHAVEYALASGTALLKSVSANDAGRTSTHQYGFYLPKNAWPLFAAEGPCDGRNHDRTVSITWQDERITQSRVVWYGKGTRSEYRLTRFGREFPYRDADSVGDLLVLIPSSGDTCRAYVLETEEDIAYVHAALGTDPASPWAVYNTSAEEAAEAEDECIEGQFRAFTQGLAAFPRSEEFSETTRKALANCVPEFGQLTSDARLVRCMSEEYRLFRMAERTICTPQINVPFGSIDDFISLASAMMNRRKARAGRSLESHVHSILREARIPCEQQPPIDGRPDIVIPSAQAYGDRDYPIDKLVVLCMKTTCKDRWRQVLNEGTRVPAKHLLTMQAGISSKQLQEMTKASVRLVVPDSLQSSYPREYRSSLLSLEGFITEVRALL